MPVRPSFAVLAGALATAALAFAGAAVTGAPLAEQLAQQARQAIAEHGGGPVTARFATANGWPTRHPLLSGGERLAADRRATIARAVAAIPGVGGVRWADGSVTAQSGAIPLTPLHCQQDVEGLLRARTIRFEEASSAIDRASGELLDEVAAALRPCLGSIIAITGHTDRSGTEPGNLALSLERASAVRDALIRRGIPRDGLRARGMGSSQPVKGLDPADPANRRIEFSVVATTPLVPTPIDTPGAR